MAVATVPREKKTAAAPPVQPPIIVVEEIPIALIRIVDNVRSDVGDLVELADSIRQHGVLQPIRIRQSYREAGKYELVYGQRRLAAAAAAGLERIPAMVEGMAGGQPFVELAVKQLVENLQRRDLGPLEEARAFQALLKADEALTQAELARRIGRSAPYVSNALRILELDPKVLPLVASGQLSGSHAKALASLKGPAQRAMATEAVEQGYSAHRVEERVVHFHEGQKREAEELKKLASWAETAEAVLVEKGADKKTTVLTTTDGYGFHDDKGALKALKALKARGWKVGSASASYSRGKCDCNAFGVSKTWEGGVQAVRRCIVAAHYQAKNVAEGKKGQQTWQQQMAESNRQRALEKRIHDGMAPALQAAFKKLPPLVARALLWSLMNYELTEWVKEHKGDRKKPDAWGSLSDLNAAALAKELTRCTLEEFGNRYNVKLDWPAIAEAFGVKLPAEKAALKGKAKP